MYNNSFLNNSQFGAQSYAPYGYVGNSYTAQQPQRPMVAPQQNQAPFSEVRYGTLDEAKAHIVMPATSVMFINRNLGEMYIKSANNMGEPLLELFKFSKIEETNGEQSTIKLDTKDFVKVQDLEGLATKDDLKAFLRAENTSNFVTREDVKVLSDKIENLQKQLQKQAQINAILKGDDQVGK